MGARKLEKDRRGSLITASLPGSPRPGTHLFEQEPRSRPSVLVGSDGRWGTGRAGVCARCNWRLPGNEANCLPSASATARAGAPRSSAMRRASHTRRLTVIQHTVRRRHPAFRHARAHRSGSVRPRRTGGGLQRLQPDADYLKTLSGAFMAYDRSSWQPTQLRATPPLWKRLAVPPPAASSAPGSKQVRMATPIARPVAAVAGWSLGALVFGSTARSALLGGRTREPSPECLPAAAASADTSRRTSVRTAGPDPATRVRVNDFARMTARGRAQRWRSLLVRRPAGNAQRAINSLPLPGCSRVGQDCPSRRPPGRQ